MQALGVIAKALRTKALRDVVIDELSKLLPGGLKREIAYRVEHDDIELFKAKLVAEGLSRDTINYYIRYLVEFLDRVGWTLSTETLQHVYTIERPRVMGKTAVALKRFIDIVVKVKDPQIAPLLYDSFKTVQSKPKNSFRVPTLEEVKKVWEEAHRLSPCTAAIWGLMAEAGVRLDHLLRARIDGLQLDKRRLLLGEVAGPKRQPLIFLTDGAVKYLCEVYLPWRERFERMLGQKSDRLLTCEELTIYRWLKEARERAGLPWLEPRLLRKFHAQWLLDRGVDPTDIDLLQGRSVKERVLFSHYIANFERRLRQVFEQHAPRVFPQ
jgi:integrase